MRSKYSYVPRQHDDASIEGRRAGELLLDHLVRHNLVKVVQHGIDKVVGVGLCKPSSTSHDWLITELCRGPSYRRGITNCVLIRRF